MIGGVFENPFAVYVRDADFAVREPWYSAPRRLLDYLLVYIQEGEMVVWVGGAEHEFRPGSFCLVQPDEWHTLRGLTNTITPYAHFDIVYTPGRERGFSSQAGLDAETRKRLMQPRLNDVPGIRVPVAFAPPNPTHFRDTLLKAIGVWQRGDDLGHLEAQHLLTELVLSLIKAYGEASALSVSRPASLNWITSYLSFHLSEPITVEDMARRAGLSPSRFAHLFRQQFGLPPHRYFLQLRIQHAQELLEHTSYTQQQISGYSGFSNVHHFASAFKRVTNQTPGEYRRKVNHA